jgi:pilus assembly protein CpaD
MRKAHYQFMRPLRTALLLAPLALSACGVADHIADSASARDPNSTDYEDRHPIAVAPTLRSEALSPAPHGGLFVDSGRLSALVLDYSRHGHGGIEVSGPSGDIRVASAALIASGAQPSDLVLHAVMGPRGATVSFRVFQAAASPCGIFASDNPRVGLLDTTNRDSTELGCTTQHNLAAMMSDPADVLRRRSPDVPTSAVLPVARLGDVQTYSAPPKATTTSTSAN